MSLQFEAIGTTPHLFVPRDIYALELIDQSDFLRGVAVELLLHHDVESAAEEVANAVQAIQDTLQ